MNRVVTTLLTLVLLGHVAAASWKLAAIYWHALDIYGHVR